MLCHALAFHPWHKIYNCEIKDVDMKCHRLRRGTALCAVLEQLHCFNDVLLKITRTNKHFLLKMTKTYSAAQ